VIDLGEVGLVLAGSALVARFVSARMLTIGIDDGIVYYSVRRLWQLERKAVRVTVRDPILRHWSSRFCRGLELRGAGSVVLASVCGGGGRYLRPLEELDASASPPPRVTWELAPLARNMPNVLSLIACMAAVPQVVGWHTVGVWLLGISGIMTSIASALRGAPRLSLQREPPGEADAQTHRPVSPTHAQCVAPTPKT